MYSTTHSKEPKLSIVDKRSFEINDSLHNNAGHLLPTYLMITLLKNNVKNKSGPSNKRQLSYMFFKIVIIITRESTMGMEYYYYY